jgi:hypothetical protein
MAPACLKKILKRIQKYFDAHMGYKKYFIALYQQTMNV